MFHIHEQVASVETPCHQENFWHPSQNLKKQFAGQVEDWSEQINGVNFFLKYCFYPIDIFSINK